MALLVKRNPPLLLFLLLVFQSALHAALYIPQQGEPYLTDIKVSAQDSNILFLTVKATGMPNITDYYTLNLASNNSLIGPFNQTIYDKNQKKEMFTFVNYSVQTIVTNVTVYKDPQDQFSPNYLTIGFNRNGESFFVNNVTVAPATKYLVNYFSFDSINTTFALLNNGDILKYETVAIRFGDGNEVIRAESIGTEFWIDVSPGDLPINVKDDMTAPMIQYFPRYSVGVDAVPPVWVDLLNISTESVEKYGKNWDIVTKIGIIEERGATLSNIRIDKTAQIYYRWITYGKSITQWNLNTNEEKEISLDLMWYTAAPTESPTLNLSNYPSMYPTTLSPTEIPTIAPVTAPSMEPTTGPTINPTKPTLSPTTEPSTTYALTKIPTYNPSDDPNILPSTHSPTSAAPTMAPTSSDQNGVEIAQNSSANNNIYFILTMIFGALFLLMGIVFTLFFINYQKKQKLQSPNEQEKEMKMITSITEKNNVESDKSEDISKQAVVVDEDLYISVEETDGAAITPETPNEYAEEGMNSNELTTRGPDIGDV